MTRSLTAGLLVGSLALLYPADTMQINFRVVHINWSIALALLGASLCLAALNALTVRRQTWLAIAAALAMLAGCLMYEAVITLYVVPAVAVFVRDDLRPSLKRVIREWRVLALWTLPIILSLALIFVIGRQGDSYQASLAAGAKSLSTDSVFATLKYIGQTIVFTAFYRGFFESWFDIYALAWTQLSFRTGFLILAAIVVAGFHVCVVREDHKDDVPLQSWAHDTPIIRLFCGGLVLFVAGYSPFLLSVSHIIITQRTFIEAALGGAMVVTALILAFRVFLPGTVLAVAVAAPVVAATLLAQIYQHDQYNRIYAEAGRPMIQAIATIGNAFRKGETVPIVSKYGSLTGPWDFGISARMMLTYLQPGSGSMILCDGRTGRMLPMARPLSTTTCAIAQDGLNITLAEGPRAIYSRFAVIESDGTVTIHDNAKNPPAQKLAPIILPVLKLGNWTVADSWFNKREPGLAYECNFESMWGYAVPCRAFGMYEGAFSRTGLQKPQSFSWVADQRAGLIIGSLKSDTAYHVIVDLREFIVTPDINQIRMTFNNVPVAFQWTTPRRMEADIAPELVADRVNVLGLEAPLDDQYRLSIGLSHVRVLSR